MRHFDDLGMGQCRLRSMARHHMAAALIQWVMRERFAKRTEILMHVGLRVIAAAGGANVDAQEYFGISVLPRAGLSTRVRHVRDIPGLPVLTGSFYGINSLHHRFELSRSQPGYGGITCGMLTVVIASNLKGTFQDFAGAGTIAGFQEFSDWRKVIPPDANVLVVPSRISASFAWFTLERPSYLSVDQSSGVVFSRTTALEVRRRSQVLLPLMETDWKLLSSMRQARSGSRKATVSRKALTRDRLIPHLQRSATETSSWKPKMSASRRFPMLMRENGRTGSCTIAGS